MCQSNSYSDLVEEKCSTKCAYASDMQSTYILLLSQSSNLKSKDKQGTKKKKTTGRENKQTQTTKQKKETKRKHPLTFILTNLAQNNQIQNKTNIKSTSCSPRVPSRCPGSASRWGSKPVQKVHNHFIVKVPEWTSQWRSPAVEGCLQGVV